MVLRFQRVTPILSHQRTRPDDLGVTHWLQQPHRRGITAPSLSIFETKPPISACWETARRFSSVFDARTCLHINTWPSRISSLILPLRGLVTRRDDVDRIQSFHSAP